MTKRLIGIDIGRETLRVAIIPQDQGPIEFVTSRHSSAADQVTRLHEYFKGEFQFGDRLATCLPAGVVFARQLNFPFAEPGKIASALPLELSTQLPVNMDDYTVAMQPPLRIDKGARVVAAAVRSNHVAEALSPFDELNIPLQSLDLAPHAYVAGLKEFLSDGVLVCVMEQGTSLALINDGEILDHRQLPIAEDTPLAEQAMTIHREATTLEGTQQTKNVLQLMGSLATPELMEELQKLSKQVKLLSVNINGQLIEASMLPALGLALRAADHGKGKVFNLRQGPFVLKGEWAGLRKAMVIAACLATLTLITLTATMGLRYFNKQQQVTHLKQQITTLYQETFPNETTVVDATLQMQSAITQLQEDAGLIGLNQAPPTQLLRVLSDLPESLAIDLDEFTMERNEVRISGRTDTFEAVSQTAEIYQKSPLFDQVEVAESKMESSGNQVSYRMRLILAGKAGSHE